MSEALKTKVVVYTAIFDYVDYLKEPDFIPDNCKFVCFTNMPIKSRHYEIRIVNEKFTEDPVRNAKIYKILSHRYFPNYKYTVWMDGTRYLTCDIHKLIENYLSDADMALFSHRWRDCIYEEALECIKDERDDPKLILSQIEKYKKEGYPEHNGLITGGIILRRNTSSVKKVNEQWWDEIIKFSRRDQLSFNYVAFINRLTYNIIDGDYYNNSYFGYVPHLHQLKKLYFDYLYIKKELDKNKKKIQKYQRALGITFFRRIVKLLKSIFHKT